MSLKRVRIATPGEHFLYLPLYYAVEGSNGFGLLPPQYTLVLESCNPTSGKPYSDDLCYEMLVNTRKADWHDVLFSLCDPVSILAQGGRYPDARPVVLGAVVTNTAFWAVDRRVKKPIRILSDLTVFDRILCFEPGTTSYRIAERIRQSSRKEVELVVVEMGKEVLGLPGRPQGTVALSPDIMKIGDLLASKQEFEIAFHLSRTQEYSNILVTALISRQDVVKEHRELTDALLAALQRALLLVRYEDERVVAFASGKFIRDKSVIERSLRDANESHVIPPSLEVTLPQWQSTVRMYAEATGKAYTKAKRREAVDTYREYVEPFADELKELVARTVVEPVRRGDALSETQRKQEYRTLLVTIVLAIGFATAASNPTLGSAIALLASSCLGHLLERMFDLGTFRKVLYLHRTVWGLFTCVAVISSSVGFSLAWIGLLVGLFSAEVTILGAAHR